MRPHRLGLGVDLDEHGRLVDHDGRVDPDVFVVGAARKGIEWEVIAIPDLRGQAVRISDLLADEQRARLAPAHAGTA
jgi:uncharacterized NAD(P)/FAD-binding protein YdhS